MENGRIIERGNHEKLMELNGHYANLFSIKAPGTSRETIKKTGDLLHDKDLTVKKSGGIYPPQNLTSV
jgi:hypothetical protein